MARIWTKYVDDRCCVTGNGPLSGRDLRRVEQVCGPALEQKDVSGRLGAVLTFD